MGIRGVAPGVNIVPINIFNDWFTYLGQVYYSEDALDNAAAIDFAWDDAEADVLSNSWGYNTTNPANIPDADEIIAAIGRARTDGRNELGSIVVFASGNYNQSFSGVTFPANVNGVITVGAVNKNGNIWNYSSRGSEMDLVAPSGALNLNGDIRTIDREGSDGYETGNYTDRFGGTSAACPQVAGVAALMLSVNPNLTEAQVLTILQQTATDMGTSGFDNTYGYGRVNAFAAVARVLGGPITGSPLICSAGATYNITPPAPFDSIIWTCGPNLSIASGQNTASCTFYSSGSGNSWVRARLVNGCGDITLSVANVWAGAPDPYRLDITNSNYYGQDILIRGTNNVLLVEPDQDMVSFAEIVDYDWMYNSGLDHWEQESNEMVSVVWVPYFYGGYETIFVRAENACGEGEWHYETFECFDYYYFSIYPNPANEFIELSIQPEEVQDKTAKVAIKGTTGQDGLGEYRVEIWSEKGGRLKSVTSKDMHLQLSTRDLPKGKYFIHLIVDGEIYKQQLIIDK